MRTSVFASRRAGAELTEWGVKKSISDVVDDEVETEGRTDGVERKSPRPYIVRARVRSLARRGGDIIAVYETEDTSWGSHIYRVSLYVSFRW